MNTELHLGMGVKASRRNSFRVFNKCFYKVTKLLRHLGTEIFRFTTHNSRLTKALAFTLAETLIVMGVIGIVSALTLPNLNSSTGDKERVVKVKKIHQNLNDAYVRAVAVYGPIDDWFINDSNDIVKSNRLGERVTEFMKLSKDCGTARNSGCFTSGKSKKISNEEYTNFDDAYNYKFITADGASVLLSPYNIIHVDIDGPNKGPYTEGKDLFIFSVTSDGVIPYASNSNVAFSDLVNELFTRALYASHWIVLYDNADYLKFTNNSGKCPNNTTVSEANPRCK